MTLKYILVGKKPVPCEDIFAWGKWFETANRRVAKTRVDDVEISTVFIGLNHSFDERKSPLLFETMVLCGPLDGEMDRYSTWKKAEEGHAAMVARVKSAKF